MIKNRVRFKRLVTPALAVILLSLAGCAGNYGMINQADTVTRMFNEGNLPDDYTYYYTGRPSIPYAIIGLKPGYVQVSKMWFRVDPRDPRFVKMVHNLWESQGELGVLYQPQGAWIRTASGETAGIWYSYYPSAPVEDRGDGRLTIHSPYLPTRWN